jgi:hypothetical protein
MTRSMHTDKNLPEYPEENANLRLIRRLAYLLDNSIRVPGTNYRFGLDAIIGLVPGVGDTIGGAISAYIVYEAYKLGIPKKTLLHMIYNVGLEALIGVIPVVGDVFDATWKANARNVALLDKHLNSSKARQGQNKIKSDKA